MLYLSYFKAFSHNLKESFSKVRHCKDIVKWLDFSKKAIFCVKNGTKWAKNLKNGKIKTTVMTVVFLARPKELESLTFGSVDQRSIQLS